MNNNHPTFVLDRANFPMVWVNSLNAYIHLLPVTKIQYEHFLWDAPNPGLDQAWYETVTKENKRVTPQAVTNNNYWQLFMTAVLPEEAKYYQDWCDGQSNSASYAVPTHEEWKKAYQSFKELDKGDLMHEATQIPGLAPRCRTILEKIAQLPEQSTPAEQLLFVGGVMEWVIGEEKPWALYGYPHPRFVVLGRHPDTGRPLYPTNPSDPNMRHKGYGFRLLRRKIA